MESIQINYKSTTNRFEAFLSTYCQAFDIESRFSRWKTKLFAFALRSSNSYAASIVAQEIIRCKQDLSTTNAFNTINENRTSPEETHSEFKYSEFRSFIQTDCKVDLADEIIINNTAVCGTILAS